MSDDKYATIGNAFLGKVAQRLQSLQPDELSAADVARWTDVALKLRQAGMTHGEYDRDQVEASRRHPDDDEDEAPDVDAGVTSSFPIGFAHTLQVSRPQMRR